MYLPMSKFKVIFVVIVVAKQIEVNNFSHP